MNGRESLLTVSAYEIDGSLCIDIVWHDQDERLKNMSSERIVPVHSELVGLGFVEHVDAVRSSKKERLWPDLRRSAKGRRGANFSKWFTRARRDCGVYDPKVDFHSFRHNVIDALANAAVPDERIKATVGHSQGKNITQGTYRKRFDVGVVKADIERLGV